MCRYFSLHIECIEKLIYLCVFIKRVVQKPGINKQQIEWMIEEKEKKKVTTVGCNGYLVFDEMAIQVNCDFFWPIVYNFVILDMLHYYNK